jgi:hypothetical protein
MDRDYTVYRHWREHLGPLGFKHARIQAGWMKTEPQPGVYDFAWLDEIVFDMYEQGVKPWIDLAWGNKHYGEWTPNNRGLVPTTQAGLRAWAKFVEALVGRYGHIVDEWEIWNEVSGGKVADPADYVALVRHTVPAIRSLQPNATIMILALDHASFKSIRPRRLITESTTYSQPTQGADGISHTVWGDVFDSRQMRGRFEYITFIMDSLQSLGLLSEIDVISYHPYEYNPDSVYEHVAWLREWATEYAPHLKIYQGENGVPSERIEHRGLRKYEWTELTQAKWALRRLLGDLGRDIPSSYFGIMDMFYQEDINRKGLLHASADQTVHHRKQAYYALQHLAAVFDDTLVRLEQYPYEAKPQVPLSLFGYAHKTSGEQVVAMWLHDAIPSDANEMRNIDLTFHAGQWTNPAYVDLCNGNVYSIPKQNWSRDGSVYRFTSIPVYDSPVLIADADHLGRIP